MQIQFEKMPDSSRIWIYQTNRIISSNEIDTIISFLNIKMATWAAHGAELLSGFKIFHNRFVVIALDQNMNAASGCSIDASANWFKELGQAVNIDFFDRSIAYVIDNEIHTVDLLGIKKAVTEGNINSETLIFNNLTNTLLDFNQNWQIKASNSWLKKYFVSIPRN